jgi:predicted DNA-binding antitoxin AbrB/MazE fold protein
VSRAIRARVRGGALEPVERVDLQEGAEVTVTIIRVSPKRTGDPFERAAGGRKGLIDADEFMRNVYHDRLLCTRPELRSLQIMGRYLVVG